jgi:hypothetical protein
MDKEAVATKKDLTSHKALRAFQIAEYRLRHNARYSDWDDNKRLAYCMSKAFEAVAKPKD